MDRRKETDCFTVTLRRATFLSFPTFAPGTWEPFQCPWQKLSSHPLLFIANHSNTNRIKGKGYEKNISASGRVKKLASEKSQQARFHDPKFSLAFKSLTSRTTLRKQQAHQTTKTKTAKDFSITQRQSQDTLNKDLNVWGDSNVSLGKCLSEWSPGSGDSRSLGKESCPPWVISQSVFLSSPLIVLFVKIPQSLWQTTPVLSWMEEGTSGQSHWIGHSAPVAGPLCWGGWTAVEASWWPPTNACETATTKDEPAVFFLTDNQGEYLSFLLLFESSYYPGCILKSLGGFEKTRDVCVSPSINSHILTQHNPTRFPIHYGLH